MAVILCARGTWAAPVLVPKLDITFEKDKFNHNKQEQRAREKRFKQGGKEGGNAGKEC